MLAVTPSCRDGGGDSDEGGSSDGAADDAGSDEGDDGEPNACEPTPGRVGLQRLTAAEYNRTVAHLFDDDSAPADVFPADSATDGFNNNAASLTISPQLAALLLDASESVAATAMANQSNAIIQCDASEDDCAADTLRDLATRVYRRPPSPTELADLTALVDVALAEGDTFPQAIEFALAGMLMAPQFLYRGVPAPGSAPLAASEIAVLDDYALASRLSYFLWGSTPDAALLEAAAQGALSDTEGLREAFDRMLADNKADALYDGFAMQWLQLGRLAVSAPDPVAFPQFSEPLREQMLAETRLFFGDVMARDASPLEFITGNQTFASAGLAEIYGESGPSGDALVPLMTDPSQRAGVLTMPAVLTMLSNPSTPNIVRRGVWLAEAIVCAAPPPPPDGVPPEPAPLEGETERERLARHREDPDCASCHNLIDPLGFTFENYDAMGQWRTEDEAGAPVDNVGELPDGTTVDGVVGLADALAQGDDYGRCITRKLMTYSLGRTVTPDDACTVDSIASDHVDPDAAFSDLLWAVVTSDAFTTQQGDAQ